METPNERRLVPCLTGAVWFLYFLAAIPMALRAALIAPGDPAATAQHLAAGALLYRATILSDLVSYVLYIAFACLLYWLVRDTSRRWAALGTLVTLTGCMVLVVATAALPLPLILLEASTTHAIRLADRQELALLSLRTYGYAYTIALFFFGVQWLVMGPLLARSGTVPRAIGYLLALAGAAWLALSAATFLSPPLGTILRAGAMPLGALAELALALWLLLKGAQPPGGIRLDGPAAP